MLIFLAENIKNTKFSTFLIYDPQSLSFKALIVP